MTANASGSKLGVRIVFKATAAAMAGPQKKRIRIDETPKYELAPTPAGWALAGFAKDELQGSPHITISADEIEQLEPGLNNCFVDCLAFDLNVDSENPQHQKWITKADQSTVDLVESFAGKWWKVVDTAWEGLPVWKQEPTDDLEPL